jgi:uncharacterized protein YbjT (DUF2867 family)
MILVTGGTGFVGRALLRQLVNSGYPVRTLIRPSSQTPNLPRGVPVEVAVASLNDERGLRAAMRGVDVIFHLAGAEHLGARGNLLATDIKGTETLARAAADMRIKRFTYVSHLTADRASAFPVFKAKGIAEEHIRRSGVPYTIFRSAILYGPEDHITGGLARLISLAPFFFTPSHSETLLQPLWVEDLITCMLWSLNDDATLNQTFEVGGGEYFSFKQTIQEIMTALGKRRILLPMSLPYLRGMTVYFEQLFPRFPSSIFWLDYVAVNRTCTVDSIPRLFGFLPARFSYRLEHLKSVNWGREARHMLFGRKNV